MASFVFELSDLDQTLQFGKLLGELAEPGDIICLNGDLGAGKTALTQAIAKGLQVPESCYVTSPSFAILQEYPGRIPLYHMDFYRLSDSTEIEDLGFEEFFYLSGLTVIEWSIIGGTLIPDSSLQITLTINDNLSRTAEIDFGRGSWETRLHQFCEISSPL